jgi:hypothetical protein
MFFAVWPAAQLVLMWTQTSPVSKQASLLATPPTTLPFHTPAPSSAASNKIVKTIKNACFIYISHPSRLLRRNG